MTVTEAELDQYIETHRPDPNYPRPQFSRDFWRDQCEADRQYKARTAAEAQAKVTEAQEIKQLRWRIAKLERGLLTKDGWFIKAVGTVLGEAHGEIEQRLKALEDREPIALPSAEDVAAIERGPGLFYAGLWNSKHLYGPGALVTYNGAGWIAMSAIAAGTKPGDGPTGWRLAVKSDTSALRSIVKDEVKKQLRERAG
jgi:hypothetical protein